MTTTNKNLEAWVAQVAALTKPDKIHWCDGSDGEKKTLVAEMVKRGTLIPLNEQSHPGCYLHRSDPNDVARTEHLKIKTTPAQTITGLALRRVTRKWTPCSLAV